jgi:1,6-anhydro-N-acetylmuramate kinase
VRACDVGPGTRLLGLVAAQVSGSGRRVAPGHLAVQGCLRPDLLEAWSADPSIISATDVWHPHGISQKGLAAEIVKAVKSGAVGAADALCTITHLIVTAIVDRLTHVFPRTPTLAELVIIGPNHRDGLLLQQLGHRLPGVALLSEADVGTVPGGVEPAAVAMLAQLYLEQVPGNPTGVTGVQVPRVLGRLTPGSPQNWLRLVREMAKHQPVVTLRTAI